MFLKNTQPKKNKILANVTTRENKRDAKGCPSGSLTFLNQSGKLDDIKLDNGACLYT